LGKAERAREVGEAARYRGARGGGARWEKQKEQGQEEEQQEIEEHEEEEEDLGKRYQLYRRAPNHRNIKLSL
jgi:hypothetical protein